MAASSESLRFDIIGNDRASDAFSRVGRSAGDMAGKMDSAAFKAALLGDKTDTAAFKAGLLDSALRRQNATAKASSDATLALAKSDGILAEVEGRLRDGALEAEFALRKEADAKKKSGDAAATAAAENKGFAAGLSALTGSGGGGMGALIAAGAALSPVIVTAGTGLGLFGAAAYSSAKPIIAAAQATGGLKTNLATLDPAQQGAAKGLLALQGDYDKFAKSVQPEIFSAFNSGLSIADGLLKDAEPVARAAGRALDGVLASLGADLHSSEWQQFFGWMAQNAGPDVQLIGQALESWLNVLPPLLEDLQPLGTTLLNLATQAGQAAQTIESAAGGVQKAWTWIGGSSLVSQLSPLMKYFPTAGGLISSLAHLSGNASTSLKGVSGNLGKTGTAAQKAAPQVGTLASDVAILATSTSSANTQISAFNDLWNIFVGNAVGDQQAVLNTAMAFDSYTAAVKQSGVKSTTAQSAFLNLFSSMQSGLGTLEKNGASVSAINGYYQTNISRLDKLHGLTPQQKADVAGLTKDYGAWAASTWGLNKNLLTAAGSLENSFIAQLVAAHRDTPKVNSDVSNLANSVLKTGTTSSATYNARQQLIRDLEKAGASAQTAAGLVNGLQKQINGLHGKNLGVTVSVTGHGGEYITSSTGANGHVNVYPVKAAARGWKVNQGTTPTADDVPVLVSRGETIVSAADSMKLAPAFRALRVPGYASGGLVGSVDTLGSYAADYFSQANAKVLASSLHTVTSSVQSALQRELSGGLGALPHGNLGGTLAEVAFAESLFGRHGWGAGQVAPLEMLWTRESGWNPYAVNPSSGAYGIPQSLGHGHPYNLGDAKAQIAWGENYVAQRYVTPQNAWAHEMSFGWYDRGGYLPPGLSLAYNGTGKPEPVGPVAAAAGAGGNTYHITVSVPPGANMAEAGRVTVDAIRAFEKRSGKGWRS
jgi:hypothetical protein